MLLVRKFAPDFLVKRSVLRRPNHASGQAVWIIKDAVFILILPPCADNACLVGWKDNLAGQEERGYRGVTKHK